MFVLAEISDKIPSNLSTLLVSVILTAVALGLARLRWWIALLAVPIFLFWNWVQYSDLQESGFGPRIWKEMGTAYVVGQFVAINAPAAVGAWIVSRCQCAKQQRRRQTEGLCPRCAYPVAAEQCPECGASVRHPRTG